MRATMDAAGRIVVPAAIRDELGLSGGPAELGISTRDGRIELAVPITPMQLEERDGVVAAVPAEPPPTLTGDLAGETLERTRR